MRVVFFGYEEVHFLCDGVEERFEFADKNRFHFFDLKINQEAFGR